MTQVGETPAQAVTPEDDRPQCQCETFARVTERSALAGARWLGRADKDAAEHAAFAGARLALERMPISGHVVIGGHEEAEQLAAGTSIGAGGEEFDLALDPLEGRAVVARGGTNAISMIAAAPRGSMPSSGGPERGGVLRPPFRPQSRGVPGPEHRFPVRLDGQGSVGGDHHGVLHERLDPPLDDEHVAGHRFSPLIDDGAASYPRTVPPRLPRVARAHLGKGRVDIAGYRRSGRQS